MKPRTKKILIVVLTSVFLSGISYFKITTDYYVAKNLHLTRQTQKIFWDHLTSKKIENAGGIDYSIDGPADIFSRPGNLPQSFRLDLNDQYQAKYANHPEWPDQKDVLEISVFEKGDVDANPSYFFISQKTLDVVDYEVPYLQNYLDQEKSSDSETKKLKQLAIQRLIEFQDEYFEVNK